MNRWTPRKKHAEKPVIKTKTVRIDFKTQIEVSVNIPDDVARQRFIERINRGPRAPYASLYPTEIKEANPEIAVGTLEELATVVDDANLPDTE